MAIAIATALTITVNVVIRNTITIAFHHCVSAYCYELYAYSYIPNTIIVPVFMTRMATFTSITSTIINTVMNIFVLIHCILVVFVMIPISIVPAVSISLFSLTPILSSLLLLSLLLFFLSLLLLI